MEIISKIKRIFQRQKDWSAREAYKIWSETYDSEQDNLILFYDNIILKEFFSKINFKEKTILDYGCGTGRNWKEIFNHNPGKIIGCDISPEMLSKVKIKFPNAETHLLQNEKLTFLADKSCDIIISTLVIAHIKNLNNLFREWDRVIRDKSEIIITDLHPQILENGGSRSFHVVTNSGSYNDKTVTIKNFIHKINKIEKLLHQSGFRTSDLIEKKIDEDVKLFYEKKNAIGVYERFKGLPFIYGLYLTR